MQQGELRADACSGSLSARYVLCCWNTAGSDGGNFATEKPSIPSGSNIDWAAVRTGSCFQSVLGPTFVKDEAAKNLPEYTKRNYRIGLKTFELLCEASILFPKEKFCIILVLLALRMEKFVQIHHQRHSLPPADLPARTTLSGWQPLVLSHLRHACMAYLVIWPSNLEICRPQHKQQ